MTEKPPFPGQVERIDFNLEQLQALASPVRSEVFWTFTRDHPQSVAEVARAIGKSAQTVHYHVNGLVEVGLLIAVDERKRGARMEKLYVFAARMLFSRGPGAPIEHFKPIVKGFQAITRTMGREFESLCDVYVDHPELGPYGVIRRVSARVNLDRAAAINRRLNALADEIMAMEADEDGIRININILMTPTLGESRQILKDAKSAKTKKGKSGGKS
jgi:hypothetical protein